MEDGHNIFLCQSYAKNMGLYGERIGAFSILSPDPEVAAKVMSQVKILIRGIYSSPPIHGERLVTELLTDAVLRKQWFV